MSNLGFVVVAFGIIWAAFFVYVIYIWKMVATIEKEIAKSDKGK